MKKKRIAFDIDGVITDNKNLVPILNDRIGKKLTFEDYTEYSLRKCYGIPSEEMDRIMKEESLNFLETEEKTPNINQIIEYFRTSYNEGETEIYLVSARDESLREITKENLNRFGVRYDKLVLGCNPKEKYLDELGIDVVVEDRLATLVQWKEINDLEGREEVLYILMDRPYNQSNNFPYIIRITDKTTRDELKRKIDEVEDNG